MKHRFHKLISLLLALAVVLAEAMPAWASAAVAVDSVEVGFSGEMYDSPEGRVIMLSPAKEDILSLTVLPSYATEQGVNWTSSDTRIATVRNGAVTAGRDSGYATITATALDGSGKSDSIRVYVPPVPVTGLRADGNTVVELHRQETTELTVVASPFDATFAGDVVWTEPYSSRLKLEAGKGNPNVCKVTAPDFVASQEPITVRATSVNGNFSVTFRVQLLPDTDVTGVTLDEELIYMDLSANSTNTLTATISPSDATEKVVRWSSDNENIVRVTGTDFSTNLTTNLTAVGVGTTTVRVLTRSGGYTASCRVVVSDQEYKVTRVTIDQKPADATRAIHIEPGFPYPLTVSIQPSNASNKHVNWSAKTDEGREIYNTSTGVTTGYYEVATVNASGIVTGETPGRATVTATAADGSGTSDSIKFEVSGIVIDPALRRIPVGGSTTIYLRPFGEAIYSSGWAWSVNNPEVARINGATGEITGVGVGTAVITCTDGTYTNTCDVQVYSNEVVPIEATLTDGMVRFGDSNMLRDLMDRCQKMTDGGKLEYITGLMVSTEQGTLYDHYISEADTGAGISDLTKFYYDETKPGVPHINDIYFVPRPGFVGIAEIRYNGYTELNDNNYRNSYLATITVEVSGSTETVSYISYNGVPVQFSGADFSNYSVAKTGRALSSLTFTMPTERQGTLQYQSYGDGTYERPVAEGTRFYPATTPCLDDVWFVPASALTTRISIPFIGYDIANDLVTGSVIINVKGEDKGSAGGVVYYSLGPGQRIWFRPEDFLRDVTGFQRSDLRYITFGSLSSSQRGTLYYGSGNRVYSDDGMRFYADQEGGGRNLISDVYFQASSGSNAPGTTNFSFTAVDFNGNNFRGRVEITVTSTGSAALSYTVGAGQRVNLRPEDFRRASRDAQGRELSYIFFDALPDQARGVLYGQDNTAVTTGQRYYSTDSNYRMIEDLYFVASPGFSGTVQIPYTGYDTRGSHFVGTVTFRVASGSAATATDAPAPTPPVVQTQGSGGGLVYGSYGYAVSFRPEDFLNDAKTKLKYELANIRFYQPSNIAGRLVTNYVNPMSYTVLDVSRTYTANDVSNIWFLPKAGYSGPVSISFMSQDITGKRYSGTLIVYVTPNTTSMFFDDLTNYGWAVPAIDFLTTYGYMEGTDYRRFNPSGAMKRGDFLLLLSRAYSYPYTGTRSYVDINPTDYYAGAISAARALGVLTGNYDALGGFQPEAPITREDAALFMFRSMRLRTSVAMGTEADLESFLDREQIAEYNREAVASLVQMRILEGDGRYFRPQNYLTRAETAQILYKALVP